MPTDTTVDLIRALIDNMRGADENWESLAMVIDFGAGKFGGTHGYTYGPGDSTSAVASRPWPVRPAVDAYVDSHYEPGAALPVAILVQFDRTKGEYEVTFEDSDASRWGVTPANLEEIRERLRPSF